MISKYDNNPLAERILSFAVSLVGYLRPQIGISDETLRKDIMDAWDLDTAGALCGGEPLEDVIGDMYRNAWVGGDAVVLHTFDPTGRYRAAYIDIASPQMHIDGEGNLTLPPNATTTPIIPAGQYTLLRWRRKDKWRGKSAFTAIDKHLADVGEITGNYKEAIKSSSHTGTILLTEAAPTTPIKELGIFSSNGEGEVAARNETVPGGTVVLRKGEDIKVLSDDRPRPEVRGFLDDLKAEIGFGFGLPSEILFDLSSLRGANTRLRNSEAGKWVRDHRAKAARLMAQIWGRWVMSRIILPRGIVDAAQIAQILRPKWVSDSPLTVDERYTSQTTIDFLDKGLITRAELAAATNQDWIDVVDQVAREREYMIERGLITPTGSERA